MNKYLAFLIINPITFISLFSVNKEIITLLAISFFVSSLVKLNKLHIILALLFSLLAKKELMVFMLILYGNFYFIPSWNDHKLFLYFLYIAVITAGSYYINNNFNAIAEYSVETETAVGNAGSGGTILMLNDIQNKYGYYLVVIPKTMLNLYGSVFSRTNQMIHFEDVYNDVVVWGQSFLFLYIIPKSLFIQLKKVNLLSNKLFFSVIISYILFSYIPVVQNRYFYSSYLLTITIISINQSNFETKRIGKINILK